MISWCIILFIFGVFRLVQLEGHLQKHLQEKNADIAAWLRRQADKVKIQLTESQNQEL